RDLGAREGSDVHQLGNYRTPPDDLEAANMQLADRFRELNAEMEQSTVSRGTEQKRVVNGEAIGAPVLVPLDATASAVTALAETLIETTTNRPQEAEDDRIFGDVSQKIWSIIVEPVVLQLTNVLKLRKGSPICWVPTSKACSLPLHAAGSYMPGDKNLPNLFVSSYAPSMSTLLHARTGYQPHRRPLGSRWLVVAQPAAEGEPVLWNVGLEVDAIRQIGMGATVVQGEGCTRDAVLDNLKDTAWNVTDSFQSHFSLLTSDAPLTVLDILKT
ncbi:hypothetical protein FRB96_008566, partial [Tulasnella sp. 330]